MMDPLIGAALIGGGADILSSFSGMFGGGDKDHFNESMDFAKQQFRYGKKMNRVQQRNYINALRVERHRDDTKLQRLVADANRAGIHPLAAMGAASGGGYASPVSPSFGVAGGAPGGGFSEG